VPTTTLTIAKTAADLNGPPIVINDTIRYTLLVTNTGAYTAFNVTLTDDLPNGVTYIDALADLGSPTGSDPVIWTIPQLPTDTTATLFITVTINSGQEGQTITNTAGLTASNVFVPPGEPSPVCLDGSPQPCPPIVGSAVLLIAKTAVDLNGPPVVVSDTVRYTLMLTNTGAYTAFNVTLTDDLPNDVTYIDALADLGSPTGSDPVIWTIPQIPTDTMATLFITVTVDPGAVGQVITNTASVTAAVNLFDPPDNPLPVCLDGSPQPCTPVVWPTTLLVAKIATDVDGPPLAISDTIRYTLLVTNTGVYTAFNVVLTDDLPNQVTCRAVSGDSSPAGCADPIVWVIPTLAPFDTVATLFITVTVNPTAAGQSITNTASVSGTNVLTPPDSPPPVCPDGSPLNAEGACDNTPTIPIPTCTPDSWEVDDTAAQSRRLNLRSNQIVAQAHAFHLPTDQDWIELLIRPGASYTFTTSNLASMADTQLTLYASDGNTILAQNDDYEPDNRASQIEWTAPLTPLNQTVYLAVSQTFYDMYNCSTYYIIWFKQSVGGNLNNSATEKTAQPQSGSLTLGSPLTYTISVYNNDDRWAAPVTVTDTLPANLTLNRVNICNPSGEVNYFQYEVITENNDLTWIGALGPNTQLNLCASVFIARRPGTATNVAWISWNEQRISRSAAISINILTNTNILYLPFIVKN
jgi:uncharacterized repeat protein (TIGR01451 family)